MANHGILLGAMGHFQDMRGFRREAVPNAPIVVTVKPNRDGKMAIDPEQLKFVAQGRYILWPNGLCRRLIKALEALDATTED